MLPCPFAIHFAMPVYVAPTPDADSVIDGESGIVTFTLKAQSTNGPIAEFQYQAPTGLVCSDVLDCECRLYLDFD